jgi:putative copper resistance protein D
VLYFSPIYAYTLQHPWAHDLAHLHFLLVGCIFFWPLLGIDPLPHRPPHWMRVVLLFLMLPFHAFLGLALMSDSTPIAAAQYAAVGRTWGASALSDQYTGGGLIWGAGDLVSGFLFFIVLMQWSKADEREARRLDRAMDGAEALAARRALREQADAREADEVDALAVYNARLAKLAEEG